jgi:rubrerythrin
MSGNEKLIKIFEYALNQEETGKSFFQHSLKRLGMGAAVSAFKRLIQEEEKHIDKDMALEPMNYFDERARSEFLQQCVEGSMVPDVSVFNTAWLIEKDLSEFYERMANSTEGKAKEALMRLSRWEKGHELFFRKYRDKLSETYSKMPWGG